MRLHILPLLLALLLVLSAGPVTAETISSPVYSASELFTERDLLQEADVSGAEKITVVSGEDVRITAGGVYVLSGTASGMTVCVDAGPEAKVQLVLDGLSIINEDFPCVYILTADKVFITIAADSSLSVTGTFRKDGNTKTDGALFSKQDTVLNGTASLSVSSGENGIVCKDDLKITGGTYQIEAAKKAIEAKDSIRIAGGTFILDAGTDGLHAENKNDEMLGYIYIGGGVFNITAGDEGIYAVSVLQIDGGTFSIRSADGFNAALVQLNGGSGTWQ